MSQFSVPVSLNVLIDTMVANRDKHKRDYEVAVEGWRIKLSTELKDMLNELSDGGRPVLHITNREPESYLSEYDEVIGLLKMANTENVDLTQDQYREWVLDQWGWKDRWAVSNSVYAAAARP